MQQFEFEPPAQEHSALASVASRGCRSHVFRLPLRSCSKILESWSRSGSRNFSNLRIGILFRLRLPSIQPKFTQVF